MANFKVQIEDLVGTVGDDNALTQWLQDGTREVTNILPPNLKNIVTLNKHLLQMQLIQKQKQ